MNERYKILFEPIDIGPKTAKNRFYQVPHAMGSGNDMPNTRAAQRGIKAEGGWSVVNTGYCSIHPSSDDRPLPMARLWSEKDVASHVPMVEAVHEHDALAGIEFFHGGAYAANRHTRIPPMSPSGIQQKVSELMDMHLTAPKVMDKKDIKDLIQWHLIATERAIQAGFDIIYCYAGMGFLPYHFLHPTFNKRTDEYGGSLENRSRLMRELITEMKTVAGDRAAIAVRMSTDELLNFKSESSQSEAHEFFEINGELPDLWDIKMSSWFKECPSGRFAEPGHMEPYNGFVKKLTSKPVVGVGWFTSPDIMAKQINDGILDFVGAARASIADPFLPNKIKEGREDDIRECIGCNICASCYNQGIPVRCTQNPSMGEEWRRGWHPEKVKPKSSDNSVLVIGGGPAGLEATLSLARRGYSVAIADSEKELGGRINKEAKLPGMSSYKRVIDYRVSQINQLENVDVYLDNTMARDDVLELGFDHVVTATGSTWQPSIMDEKSAPILITKTDSIFTPEDVLEGYELQSPVIIFDFDYYYMGGLIAEYIKDLGHEVTIITPFEKVSPWSFNSNEVSEIESRLLDKDIKVLTKHRINDIGESSIEIIHQVTNKKTDVDRGSLVLVGHRKQSDSLYTLLTSDEDALKASGIKSVQNIGDSNAPGAIVHATYAGHLYANTFDQEDGASSSDFKLEYPVIQ
ncbi:FAD-dependent oxidoreductase [Gammaproteobacteria bacterium]|nr:FAD-dependent oxidoreductase [Gammaproteobacteria bacterium]